MTCERQGSVPHGEAEVTFGKESGVAGNYAGIPFKDLGARADEFAMVGWVKITVHSRYCGDTSLLNECVACTSQKYLAGMVIFWYETAVLYAWYVSTGYVDQNQGRRR